LIHMPTDPILSAVRSLATRLLVLLAVLLMPLGMTAAPAASPQHHSASLPMQHCADKAPKPAGTAGFTACTMVCSAALPVDQVERGEGRMIVCAPAEAAAVRQLDGLHPETATPPPRRS
jgi:hypothetical protein